MRSLYVILLVVAVVVASLAIVGSLAMGRSGISVEPAAGAAASP